MLSCRRIGATQEHRKEYLPVFFDGPSQGANPYEGLTDEQMEDVIAEHIFDWWISGKPYKQWYAEKFLQTKFEFNDEQEQDENEQTT